MDNKLQEILKEFEEKFNHLNISEEYCPGYQVEYFNVKKFLTGKLQSYAKDYALSLLPDEEQYSRVIAVSEYYSGFNACIKQIKDKIK